MKIHWPEYSFPPVNLYTVTDVLWFYRNNLVYNKPLQTVKVTYESETIDTHYKSRSIFG